MARKSIQLRVKKPLPKKKIALNITNKDREKFKKD